MNSETKAKIKAKVHRVMETVKEWTVPILLTSTVAAAWSGYVTSNRNERKIENLQQKQTVIRNAANLNAENLNEAMDHIRALEKENEKLLDKAVFISEGKDAAC